MRRFLIARRVACGSPLSTIKKSGGVDSTGGIDWKAVAAYRPTFGEHGRLVKLKHRSGAVVDVDAVFTKDTLCDTRGRIGGRVFRTRRWPT